MKRFGLLAMAALFALGACMEAPPKPKYVPAPTLADFTAREDCLYRVVCPEIAKRGTAPLDLEGSGEYAAAVCNQDVSNKMMQHAASTGGYSAMDDAITDNEMEKMKFQQHAIVVAQQLKDQCAAKH